MISHIGTQRSSLHSLDTHDGKSDEQLDLLVAILVSQGFTCDADTNTVIGRNRQRHCLGRMGFWRWW